MATPNLMLPLPVVPSDVYDFVFEKHLTSLPEVLRFTRETFPSSQLTVCLGQDAEEESHRYVALDVEVAHLSAQELLTAQQAWSAGLGSVCPPGQATWFVLGWK